MKTLIISMNFETDGDVAFHNKKNYLNSSWEEYNKTIICSDEDFFEQINELITYLNKNVYNKYSQHEWLVDFVKNLTLVQIFNTESNNVDDYIDKYKTVLSGNQDFSFSVSLYNKEEIPVEEKIKTFKNLYTELKDHPDVIKFLHENF